MEIWARKGTASRRLSRGEGLSGGSLQSNQYIASYGITSCECRSTRPSSWPHGRCAPGIKDGVYFF